MRLAPLLLVLVLGACSSEKREERLADPETASVDSGTPARAQTPHPESETTRRDEASSAGRPAPVEAAHPSGPRDVHADRERILEDEAAKDRPAGTTELKLEADGATYRPGPGLLPRYSVGTVERRDAGPEPDSGVMKYVPGSKIDVPPPPAKPPEEIPSTSEPGQSVLVPREVK
jgi:hypothetical protein